MPIGLTMISPIRRLASVRRRLSACDSGIAMTEFAMALPVLLTLGLAGMETAWLMLSHLRVSNIAMLTADGASRVRERIDEADVNELLTGALLAGEAIQFKSNGRIILYGVEPNAANTRQWVRWQRCAGDRAATAPSYGRPMRANGTLITDGTEMATTNPSNPGSAPDASTATAIGPTGNQIAAQSGTAVMLAEVVYDYQPLVSDKLFGKITIRYTSAFNVRQRSDQVLYNAAANTVRSCGA